MSKKAIWAIIGLMTVAVLGIVLMQAYWINWYTKLNEKQFDKSVISVLSSVAKQLEQYEIDATLQQAFNNNANAPANSFFSLFQSSSKVITSDLKMDLMPMDSQRLNREVFLQQGQYEAIQRQLEITMAKRVVAPKPIDQRLDIGKLEELLVTELADKGIDLDFNYGIFSAPSQRFVFTQQYVCEDEHPALAKEGLQMLYNSPYRVRLFPTDFNTPGYLMLFFPGKSEFVWQSVLPSLLSTILFIGIVLFCFGYTIYVIFEQKKLSEIKTDFINNMTHEFKTPIATISLAADSITSPMILGNTDKVKRFASIIKAENKRMNSQVEKVLQMALLDKSKFKLNYKDIDLHQVIEAATKNISLQVEKKQGEIITELNADKYMIQGDLTHISNVIHNLLDNANKYSPEKPKIIVRTKNAPNGVQIEIEDNGIGMDAEARKRIFDKFYRVHTGNRHDVKGFGLGLSYVKVIITAHKGQIDVKSELGKGSKFILFFPFHVENR